MPKYSGDFSFFHLLQCKKTKKPRRHSRPQMNKNCIQSKKERNFHLLQTALAAVATQILPPPPPFPLRWRRKKGKIKEFISCRTERSVPPLPVYLVRLLPPRKAAAAVGSPPSAAAADTASSSKQHCSEEIGGTYRQKSCLLKGRFLCCCFFAVVVAPPSFKAKKHFRAHTSQLHS